MRKKKVLVHGTRDSVKLFFQDAISRDYEILAILNEQLEGISITHDGKELEVLPAQNLPKFVENVIDAIIITDTDNKESIATFFVNQGFELRKIIIWDKNNGYESFEFKGADDTRLAVVNGLEFPLSTSADEKALKKYIASLKKIRYIKNLDPKLYGVPLETDNLTTFTKKLQWLKIHDATLLKTRLADKYRVRNWIAEKIGAQYLIPLLGVWDDFDDINFDDLPNQFVLKVNHSSGKNIFVRDKKNFDKEKARRDINLWMSISYVFALELHYANIDRKIIAEELMTSVGLPDDYKFLCINGKIVYCQYLTDRLGELKLNYFDENWKVTNVERSDHPRSNHPEEILPPKNFELMKELATKLAEGFAFVRVDFYEIEGRVYFGEMTFTPAGGFFSYKSEGTDEYLGSLLKLPEPTAPPRL